MTFRVAPFFAAWFSFFLLLGGCSLEDRMVYGRWAYSGYDGTILLDIKPDNTYSLTIAHPGRLKEVDSGTIRHVDSERVEFGSFSKFRLDDLGASYRLTRMSAIVLADDTLRVRMHDDVKTLTRLVSNGLHET